MIDLFCDRCGKSCRTSCGFEYATLTGDWGFDTKKDMEGHCALLCEACYDETLATMKIKPSVHNYDSGGDPLRKRRMLEDCVREMGPKTDP